MNNLLNKMIEDTEKKKVNELSYIAIEGVIGAGKTTLATLMKEDLNADLILEQFESNPFLEKFYKDRERYAFQTQIFFLLNRYKQQQEINQTSLFSKFLVSDYIFDKDKIFAMINLSAEEYKLYDMLYTQLEKNIIKPDLVIYLQCSVDRLMNNIKKRNRPMEKSISKDYISELSEAYNQYFFTYRSSPLLIVNATDLDFLSRKSDYEELKKLIFRKDRALVEYYSPPRQGLL